ncbi:S8 family serine peptidase [Natronoglycomyces albus]|uniref:S8 family serine peptidase n=1 Tax=Natronoglycomyces albus TaxID=2811108 RepID=A0A895XRB5_9ACTN|nr:S8 family serine peptidase [Natronoglycomyces albus]QSB05106.1 S8 family serine peptidase [Natronoglycomyces albus]
MSGAVIAAAALTAAGMTLVAANSASAEPTSNNDLEVTQGPTEEHAYLDDFEDGYYIVQFDDEPAATYSGEVSGLNATAVKDGEKFDPDSPEVKSYRAYLAKEREEILEDVDDSKVSMVYDSVFNGVSMYLTAEEAKKLNKNPKVKGIFEDRMLEIDTLSTPEFVGLEGGSWDSEFGGAENAGEGTIVGIIDTGIDHTNPSLAPLPEPRPDQDIIDAKWDGVCDEGEEENPAHNVTCNNKLIGAQWFDSRGEAEHGFASPLEELNHGTHVATTAAGNHDVEVVLDGNSYGTVSGMAPAARVAAYKVCWGASGLCAEANSVAAIEAALNDGVDVLNFSISGSRDSVITPVSVAYFNAASAGIFVSVSAGNSGGSGPSTVAHNYPWVTTVAASTHDKTFQADYSLGDGQVFPSGSFLGEELELPVVLAEDVAFDDANPAAARTCTLGTIDPDKVDGEAVLCERGNPFVDTDAEMINAGAGAVIVANTASHPSGQYVVIRNQTPTVHVDYDTGVATEAYVNYAGDDATVTLGKTERIDQTAPSMAAFSSYGPANAGGGNLLKPDITAPGVEIMAGYPEHTTGTQYGLMQGTSMSSPHIAGLGALIASANPDWSPAMIKSAMMTTAYTEDNSGNPIKTASGADATPMNYGAGHVDGSRMFNPGLVYDADGIDWAQYGCGLGQFQQIPNLEGWCDAFGGIEPSQLNYPSISVGSLTGEYTVTRTVTNVDKHRRAGVYFPHVQAPDGFDVSVSTRTLVVRPGQTASFDVTIKRTTADFNEYAYGSLTWIDGRGHQVHSPIVVQPVELDVDGEVSAEGTSGDLTLEGKSGFTGNLAASSAGLFASVKDVQTLSNADGSSFPTDNPVERDQTFAVEVSVPADVDFVRFGSFDDDHTSNADVDLFAFHDFGDGNGLTLVGSSAASGSDEVIDLPGGYTFTVFVDLWSGDDQDVTLHTWQVGTADQGNVDVSPSSQSVKATGDFSVNVAWDELTAGERYLGVVNYGKDGGLIAQTVFGVTA